MRYSFFLIIIILFFGCTSENKIKENDNLPNAKIQITDTIKIDYRGNLKITEFNRKDELFIAVDAARENEIILVFDKLGNIICTFDNRIAGENAVKGKISAVGFEERNGGYIVISMSGLYYFNKNWEKYNYIPNPKESQYTRFNPSNRFFKVTKNDKEFILTQLLTNPTGYNIESREHYNKVKLLTIINSENESFNLDLGFDELSNYRTESKLYAPYIFFFDYLKKEDKIITTFTNEKHLYFYEIDKETNLKLTNRHTFDFDYYKINSQFNYGDVFDIYKASFDSKIQSLKTYEDRIFINYTKEVDNSEFENNPMLYNDFQYFQDYMIKNYRQCMHIIEDGKKLYKDIILPDMLVTPAIILKEDEIVFNLSKSKYEFDNEVFFIGKINKVL
jgi:hypothetical protein